MNQLATRIGGAALVATLLAACSAEPETIVETVHVTENAAPASPSFTDAEQSFLEVYFEVVDPGSDEDPAALVSLAQSVCEALEGGVTGVEIYNVVKEPLVTHNRTIGFLAAGVHALCPDFDGAVDEAAAAFGQ